MTNPAMQLHSLLERWNPQNKQSIFHARGGEPDGNEAFWRMHGHAVSLLREVERLLDGLKATGEDTSVWEEYLPAWYRGVFAPKPDWGNQTAVGHQPINNASLHSLWSLGRALSMIKYAEAPDEETLRDLSDALDEANRLAHQVGDLPDQERIYILGLIEEARKVVADVETFGTAGLRRITAEIGGSLIVVAGRTSNEPLRSKLLEVARRFLNRVWWKSADAAIDSGIEVMKQIGS